MSDNNIKYEQLAGLVKKVNSKVNFVGRKVIQKSDVNKSLAASELDENVEVLDKAQEMSKTTMVSTSTQTDVAPISDNIMPLDSASSTQGNSGKNDKTPYLQQPKVLYVTDTVGSSANMRLVEKFSKTRVRTVHSSGSDKQLEEIVKTNLVSPGREPYDMLLIAAPTDDISNLKIHEHSKNDIEQQVKDSCNNVLNIAKKSLIEHKELKKVVVLEHPPRFDSNVKSEMVSLANKTYKTLINDLKHEHNVELGVHNLYSYGVGKTYDARYRNSIMKKVDGLHFFGPCGSKDYSESLVNILVNSLKNTSTTMSPPETLCVSEIPVSNRFEVLSQGN